MGCSAFISSFFFFFFFFAKQQSARYLFALGMQANAFFFRERVAALVQLVDADRWPWKRIAGSNPPAAMIPVCTPVASNGGMPDGDLEGREYV